MNTLSIALLSRLIGTIADQPRPLEALIRFVYYTEEFVERYEISAVLPHLDDDEREAMLAHFKDEESHARALRVYCEKHDLPIERSASEEALVRRSDEGYAQYLRHLDPETNRFTAAEMYAYYCHVALQEQLADTVYRVIADELARRALHPRFVRILRAFAESERDHEDYAVRFMERYERQIGRARAAAVRLRTRWLSASTGAVFLRDFVRLLRDEHGLRARALAWVV